MGIGCPRIIESSGAVAEALAAGVVAYRVSPCAEDDSVADRLALRTGPGLAGRLRGSPFGFKTAKFLLRL